MKFEGKVAIVTGSSKGIGLGIARAFAAEGARVVVCSRTEDEGIAAAKELGSDEGRAKYIRCDVQDLDSLKNLIEESVATFGQIDILVNNAGVLDAGELQDTDPEQWQTTMNIDLRSQFFGTQYALPYLKKTRGNVINLSSIGGMIGFPKQAAYNTVKGATIALTRALATDLIAFGIRVNTLAPGVTKTPEMDRWVEQNGGEAFLEEVHKIIPMGRLGTIDEIAKGAVYLADNDYVTGTTLVIDGGITNY
jgi:meso-butanediol dehydrogenase/(S,S)-butanediol dehydrogenase/diacetyl reductase